MAALAELMARVTCDPPHQGPVPREIPHAPPCLLFLGLSRVFRAAVVRGRLAKWLGLPAGVLVSWEQQGDELGRKKRMREGAPGDFCPVGDTKVPAPGLPQPIPAALCSAQPSERGSPETQKYFKVKG